MNQDELLAEIKAATPEELLEVAKNQYLWSQFMSDIEGTWRGNPETLMDMAFRIGKGEGWRVIAPAWLEEYREQVRQEEERRANMPHEFPRKSAPVAPGEE